MSVSRISSIEIKLGVSAVAETIQVSASAVTVDTVSTALSAVIQPKQVQDLPLNGRDFTRMLQLAPGRRRQLGERRAHAREQLPDRRRRQQRRVSEHRRGQSGRRLGHRRHAAADRGDRSVLRSRRAGRRKWAAMPAPPSTS